ncbi:MAG: nickel-dependent hydrogenase large subunit [Chloroflexi bacterium]|nr:nickel-dependent hydrogenase large subunit [Chloroflexota bacterium]
MAQHLVIPIGPQHPALKEPMGFRFRVEGERVLETHIRMGYVHRGIERACQERSYIQALYLVERVCGICSHIHTTAFCQGVEELSGVEIPPRALYIRTIVCELERIHSHLLWLGVIGRDAGFDTLFMYTWRDRETALDILEEISGNRINHAANTIGGVRIDLTSAQIESILEKLDYLEEQAHYYLKLVTTEATFVARTHGVGYLSREDGRALCVVGPTTRASGVDRDVRRDDPYAAYGELPFQVITVTEGDCQARTVVRVKEIIESVRMIRHALHNLPEGQVRVRVRRRIPPGEVISRVEAPRGELIYYIKSDGTERPARVKIRAPTLANMVAVPHMLKGAHIADVPIVVAAIDLCIACADR